MAGRPDLNQNKSGMRRERCAAITESLKLGSVVLCNNSNNQ